MKIWREYLTDLIGTQCQCGQSKKPKVSFCETCFYKLPFDLKESIYRDKGKGYDKFYNDAVEFLNK
jgi:hypothetical protein